MTASLPLIDRATEHGEAIAFACDDGNVTYLELLKRSAAVASTLLDGANDLNETRVAYLIPSGPDYIATQWGIWRSGGVAVPLSLSATVPELQYSLTDSQSETLVVTERDADNLRQLCNELAVRLLVVEDVEAGASTPLPDIAPSRRAMILYTSGTTSKPKGVVSTHANIQAQIEALVHAWRWAPEDCIPLFLPLHHIHGIINVMSCALWTGAKIEPFEHFDMATILPRVSEKRYTLFMAVPTIYVKLIKRLQSSHDSSKVIEGFRSMRLMISGSAALPASVHETWTALTGQNLLERYGMTEIGMGLSNPYEGERRPGAVGMPLPGVQVRLKSESGEVVETEHEAGEIQVRGPAVFLEYWNRPKVTADSFDDGWFRTGDIAVREDGYYRIMGRQSVDIIKSGGYKLSALEIESALLDHPAIAQCAVVGIPDETWGEAVAVAAVLNDAHSLDLLSLRQWCDQRLSRYKIPKQLLIVNDLPRNAMGKVTKPAVSKLF